MKKVSKKQKKMMRVIAVLFAAIMVCLFLLFSTQKKDKTVIAVDAAFGNGTGFSGLVQEDEYNRKIADALCALLKKDNAFEVLETSGSVKERAEQIESADLLITIRQSFSMDASLSGVRIAVDDAKSETAVAYAQALSTRCEEAGLSVSVGTLLYTPIREGVQQEHFVPLTDTTEYEEETIPLFEASNVHGVAFMPMYVSNEEDVARFTSEEGIQEAAKLCVKALKDIYE